MSDPFNIVIKDCFQGSPIPLKFNFWLTPPDPDATPPVAGVPKDISGWQFFFTWKKTYTDPDSSALYLLDWLMGPTAGTSGSTGLTIPSAKTSPVPAKTLTFWDLKVIQVTGDPGCALNGTIYLNPAVTQRLTPQTQVREEVEVING